MVLPEYVLATGPRLHARKYLYVYVAHAQSLAALMNIQRVRCRRKTIVRFISVSKFYF